MPDPLTIGAIAAPVIGGLLGFGGQQSANSTNVKIAREQMAFQERMSSTAHQREMADLQAAGLNPLMAVTRGGASTPAGSSTQVQSAVGAGVNSAMAAHRQMAEIKLLKAQEREVYQRERAQQLSNTFTEWLAPARKQEAQNAFEDAYLSAPLVATQVRARVDAMVNSAKEALERGKYFEANRILSEFERNEYRVRSDYFGGLGKFSPYISGARDAVGLATDIGSSVVGMKWGINSLLKNPRKNIMDR